MECAICGLPHFVIRSRAARNHLGIPNSTTKRMVEKSMNSRGALLAGLVACFLVTSAFAQEGSSTTSASSASARKPAPEMDQLKPLIGTWACTGEVFASTFGPAHPTRGTQTFTLQLGGFWVVVRSAEDKTPQNPAPLRALGAVTYDSGRKKFVTVGYDNLGGYAIETSDTSVDNAVYTGSFFLNGTETKVRDTYTMKGNETHHVGEVQVGSDWKKLDQETCKKK